MSKSHGAENDSGPPTRADFDHWNQRDVEWAYQKFGGLTVKQAVQVVSDDFGACVEDFQCMGPRPFCYYLEAFAGYFEECTFCASEVSQFGFTCGMMAEAFVQRPSESSCVRKIYAALDRVLELLDTHWQRLVDYEADSPEEILRARNDVVNARAAYEKVLAGM